MSTPTYPSQSTALSRPGWAATSATAARRVAGGVVGQQQPERSDRSRADRQQDRGDPDGRGDRGSTGGGQGRGHDGLPFEGSESSTVAVQPCRTAEQTSRSTPGIHPATREIFPDERPAPAVPWGRGRGGSDARQGTRRCTRPHRGLGFGRRRDVRLGCGLDVRRGAERVRGEQRPHRAELRPVRGADRLAPAGLGAGLDVRRRGRLPGPVRTGRSPCPPAARRRCRDVAGPSPPHRRAVGLAGEHRADPAVAAAAPRRAAGVPALATGRGRARGHRAALRARDRARAADARRPARPLPGARGGHLRRPDLVVDAQRGPLGRLRPGRRGLPGDALPRRVGGGAGGSSSGRSRPPQWCWSP